MTKRTIFIYQFIFFISILFISCDKDSTPTEPVDKIPENLFPLQVGRQWVFDVKDTDQYGNLIPSKTGTTVSKVTRSLNLAGKDCYELVDSVKMADTIDTEINYFHIDSKGNVWQYMLFESQDTAAGPGWLKTFNRELGFDKVHTILDTIMQMPDPPLSVRLRLTSMIKRKDSVTVPIGHFSESYPAEMVIQIIAGTISITYRIDVWLVPNVGYVKFKETNTPDFGQPITGYRIKELRSKNF